MIKLLNLLREGATSKWNNTLYKQHRALKAAPRYFVTDENGTILLFDLPNTRSIESELDYYGRVNFGYFTASNDRPKIINVHDLKLNGKVVNQDFWATHGDDRYYRSSFNPDNPSDTISSVKSKYVKTTPEQKNT